MQTPLDPNPIMKRTQALWYEDGLADVTMGGYFTAIGLYLFAESTTPPGSPLWLLWGIGGPLLLILGGVAAGWILKRLKARLVFPRTGYVSFERSPRGLSGAGRLLLAAAASAAVAVGVVVAGGRLANLSLIFGLICAAAFVYLWQRLGLTRYLALAAWSALVGIALVPTGLSMEEGGAASWLLIGGALVVAGAAAWHHFDRGLGHETEEAHHATER